MSSTYMYNIPHFNSFNNNLHNTYLFVLRCIVHLSFRFIYISVPFNLLYLFFSIFFFSITLHFIFRVILYIQYIEIYTYRTVDMFVMCCLSRNSHGWFQWCIINWSSNICSWYSVFTFYKHSFLRHHKAYKTHCVQTFH